MSGTRRGLMLLAVLVAIMAGWMNTAAAQVTTTTVQDTVYSANGTPAAGTVLVSWSAFTTAGGQMVPAGTTSVTIGTGGVLTVSLAPNAGSTPMGTYYTAVFHLSDGTTSRQYWVVPVTVPGGAATATLAEIKSEVLPISVAMQTVSKEYVDDAIAAASTGFPLDSSPYVLTAGDAMTGPLTLPADPVNTNQAADKHYVDTNVTAVNAGLAQKASLVPTATQVVAQPSGTSFAIAGTNTATTFAGSGTSATEAFTTPNNSTQMNASTLDLFGQGYDCGNSGTACVGWSTGVVQRDVFASAVRGIMQMQSGVFTHTAIGDTAVNYDYLDAYGGAQAASDEAVEDQVHQVHQPGAFSGNIVTGGTQGSNLLTVNNFACAGYCATQATYQFPDGGMLVDATQGGTATATIGSYARDNTNGAMTYTLASGTVAVSTAWGSIVPSSCSPNGAGSQTYTSTTCNITLATSPASPGNFVAGTDICLAGPFQEEAAVTAVGTNIAGVQSVTFSTRYAYNGQSTFVMQGGLCGQAFTSSTNPANWPIAWAAVGATTPTTLYFSNCVVGACNGSGSTGLIPQTTSEAGGIITRTGNVATLVCVGPFCGNIYQYAVGSTITVSGYTPSDLNGTFTVLSNTFDYTNPVMTWAQTGANESSTASGNILQVATIKFFPMAFITGTNGGTTGANLATNTVNWTTGDRVVGTPTSEYKATGIYLVQGQTSPLDGSQPSDGLFIQDDGPVVMSDVIHITNNNGSPSGESDISSTLIHAIGAYDTYFALNYRPANNGTIISTGGEPVSSNAKPYNLFTDGGMGKIVIDPVHSLFNFVDEGGLEVNGSLACTVANGLCASAGGGGASFPATSGLVYNTSTTASSKATGAQIVAALGSDASIAVNGTTCTLGSSCAVSGGGGGTPPLGYEYFRAGVSDGGAAFAGAFTRYDNNQPQAGSVAPATSALGYLLFNASPNAPQYAEVTTTLPPYWTSSGMYLQFYSTATSGNAVMDVQTACVSAGQVVGAPTFTAATTSTTAVSATANGLVQTALIAGIAAPGANGCPATGMTTPTMLTIRVYADATDAVPVYFTGATLVTGRSQ